MPRYTIDRARPGLVALYDIRPGNRAGQFLKPRSLHGAPAGKQIIAVFKEFGRKNDIMRSVNFSRLVNKMQSQPPVLSK